MSSHPIQSTTTYGPPELRVRWAEDEEPYDPGDCDDEETWEYVEQYGVYGCTVEVCPPACACCGQKVWKLGASLWGIVGDDEYHDQIERELIAEVSS